MKKTAFALTLISALLFSMIAETLFLNVGKTNKTYGVPFAYLDASTVSSGTSDNDVQTSDSTLSPTELWNFTVAYSTANAISLGWKKPKVANGIVYLCNTETYIIPGEPHVYLLDIPVTHMLGTTYAINISSGEELWNLTGAGRFHSLAIIDGVAYMSTSDSRFTDGQSAGAHFCALNAVTGDPIWSHHFDGDIHWSRINDGVLYVFFIASGFNSYVCAMNTSDGSELWRWKAGYYILLSPPTTSDDTIYFGTCGSADNHYYAVSTVNGTELWSIPIEGRVYWHSSVDDDVVYFNSDEASYALDAQTGEQLSDAFNSTKLGIYSINGITFVIISRTDDALYLRSSNNTLIALNAANGEQLWNHSMGGYGSSIVSDGVVYYHLDSTLYALDASNGSSLWNYTSSDRSFLTVANGTAFFAAGNTVYAFSVPTVVHPSSTPTPEPQQDAFLTILVATASVVSVTVVGIGLLVYFRKRKR